MQILITGAAGLVGNHVVRLLAQKNTIHALDLHGSNSVDERVNWITFDLAEPFDHSRLPGHIDAVIHLAQSNYFRQFPERAQDIFNVNVQSTVRLLEFARRAGARSFVVASTGGLYAERTGKSVETDPLEARDFYFASKYAAELLANQFREYFRVIVLRFFFVYGPGQKGMLISNLMEKIDRGERIAIDGDPGLHINPIFVEDAAAAFEPALSLDDSAVINIAGDEVVSVTELVRLIGESVGKQPRIEHRTETPSGCLVGDNSRMKTRLGVQPRMTLRQGLKRMADAYLSSPTTRHGP